MASDNEIIIEAQARAEQARRDLSGLVDYIDKSLDKLEIPRELRIEARDAQAELARLQEKLRAFQRAGSDTTEVRLEIDRASANADRLAAKIKGILPPGSIPTEEITKLEVAFQGAEAAVSRFEAQAATGSRAATRSFTQAKVAVADLERQIEELRASGSNVAALEARVASLKAGLDRGNVSMGKFRAAARDVDDELRQATLSAGEFEGQLGSLEDVANSINPQLGATTAKLLSIQAVISIVTSLFQQANAAIENGAKALGANEEQAKKITKTLDIENRVLEYVVGSTKDLLFLLRSDDPNIAAENHERLAKALELEGKKAQEAGRLYAESILGNLEAIQRRNEVQLRGLDIITREGQLTARTAALLALAIGEDIEALERLGKETASLRALRAELEKVAHAMNLSEAIQQVDLFGQQLRDAGGVTREQADSIVASINGIIKSVRTLPEEDQKGFAVRLRLLQDYKAEFEKFTTAYAAELEKQRKALEENLKRQEAALESFATKLRDAFKVEKDDKGAQTAADLKREIAEAEAELLALETKGPGSIEESNRITELKDQISDLKIDLDRLGDAYEDLGPKVSEGAEQAKEAILGLLTSSEEFGETFRKLPFEFQQAIQQLVEGFVSDLESGLATGEEDVQRFISQFSTLLEQGGAVTDEFAQKLRALAGADTPVADLFAALKKGADESKASLEEAGRVAGSTAESYIKIARAAEDSGKAASAATTSTAKLKEEVIEIRGPLSAAQENTMKWKDEVLKIGPATEKAAPAVKLIASHTSTAAKNQKEWADGLKSTVEEVKKLNPLLEKMLQFLQGIAETLPKANPAHAGEVVGE